MKKAITFFIASGVLLFFFPFFCQAGQKLIVGFLDFPPYAVVGETIEGIMVKSITDAMDRSKISYELVSYPPKRMFLFFQSGKVHMIVGTEGLLDRYGQFALSSARPIMKIHVRLYAKSATPFPGDIKKITGPIGAINGFDFDGLLDGSGTAIHFVNSHDSLFKMLDRGRLKYVMDYAVPADASLKSTGMTDIKSQLVKEINLYLCLRKDFPHSEQVLQNIMHNYKN